MGEFAKLSRRRKISDLSWGLTVRLGDLTLISLFLGLTLSMPSKHTGKYLAGIFTKLQLTKNETGIRDTFYQLKRRGLIDYTKRLWQEPVITRQGEKRLRAILPQYDAVRTWDKRLYLITYDIPVLQNHVRNQLRLVLKTLGCGLLQESVWLTPYNPQKILEEFASKNNLAGQILISDFGKDGSIGEEDIRGLVVRVYKLDELNRRYQEFIEVWSGKKPKPEILPHFFSILKDDPQLPFDLLLDDWLGEKAWEIISPLLKS